MKANLIKGTAFCVVFLIIYYVTTEILRHKYRSMFGGVARVASFFCEPENSMDVCFWGASITRANIQPAVLFRDFGITSYDFAHYDATPHQFYFHMIEALKYQPNAIIAGEVTTWRVGDRSVEGKLQSGRLLMAFEQWPLSYNKLKAIWTNSFENERFFNIFPIAIYHSNWARLNRSLIFPAFWWTQDHSKGSDLYYHVRNYTKLDEKIIKPEKSEDMPSIDAYWIREICKYAQEHNIKLVLFNAPKNTKNVDLWKQFKRIGEIAEQYGIPYKDFNEDIGGENHSNVMHAEKVTQVVGKWFKEHYDIPDKRKDPQVSEAWKKPIEVFETQLNTYALRNEVDFAKMLPLLKNPNYTVMLSVRDSATRNPTDQTPVKPEIIAAWKNLGLNPVIFSSNRFQHSYLAIIDGDKVLHEAIDKKLLTYKKFLPGIGRISMQSAGYAVGNRSNIKIDNAESSPNQRGFNLVVYDKMLEQVVLNKSFDTIKLAY